MTQSPNDRDRVTDEIAQQLFTRAATIDQDGMQLAQLRTAAIEAGISGAAFDQAVREWRAGPPPRYTVGSWAHRLLRNVGAFAAGWTSIAIFADVDRLLSLPRLVHKLTDPHRPPRWHCHRVEAASSHRHHRHGRLSRLPRRRASHGRTRRCSGDPRVLRAHCTHDRRCWRRRGKSDSPAARWPRGVIIDRAGRARSSGFISDRH